MGVKNKRQTQQQRKQQAQWHRSPKLCTLNNFKNIKKYKKGIYLFSCEINVLCIQSFYTLFFCASA